MIRRLSQQKALTQLQRLKRSYQRFIKANYEHAAASCASCSTPGACCTDEHWVNVQITRLEAVAIWRALEQTPRLTDSDRNAVYQRARLAVEKYKLHPTPRDLKQTYSCPLFDKKVGCLVHQRAKPAPCIQHACYEDWRDLPPEQLQRRTEHRVAQLNNSVYGDDWSLLPIPVWIANQYDEDHPAIAQTTPALRQCLESTQPADESALIDECPRI